MRLLNVRTRQLEEHHSHSTPKYSILSHRWGDEEVTFNDVKGENGPPEVFEGKSGYRKIDFACRQALADGFDYTWVDTCCINKESSAELTESINSMFSWYQEADVCYAYLTDVADDSERTFLEELAHRSSRTFDHDRAIGKTSFAKSAWWGRSWTLQELLAPPDVIFFAENWTFLGTRGNLASVIHTVTHIDTAVLLGMNEPKHCCVARRMSWAARRAATRVEDVAYALLGLFGINMPLLYGEGENAFKRLQQEIIRSSDDQSVFAWNYGAKSPPLLAPSPRHFTLCYDVRAVDHAADISGSREWEDVCGAGVQAGDGF
ncbi:heterokaryon incompatibility protein-domain-containing protein [Coniochaeta sp. 2T2.1]|nr:heterokaryon incompatibility protein-domain-containing protein [Coniochaeta sp. 2T2.1]